jgi:hypothetical protein
MFISLEFKQQDFSAAREAGWHVWERETTIEDGTPPLRGARARRFETLVGGRPERLLDLVRFERAAKGLDQGNRYLVAERLSTALVAPIKAPLPEPPQLSETNVHFLAREFEMSPEAILSLIAEAPRLKMAVRGWVAEDHLRRVLERLPGVSDCERLNLEGRPDIRLRYRGHGPIFIECKNVLRKRTATGLARVDFQRTRASRGDPCSRYYRPNEFDILAACMHALTEQWEFMYRLPREMERHKICADRLSNNVRVDEHWTDAEYALAAAVEAKP